MIKDMISAALLIIVIVAVWMLITLIHANAAPSCMSKAQARAAHPSSTIRKSRRCWHVSSLSTRHYSYRKHYKYRGQRRYVAPAMLAKAKDPLEDCCWPDLDRDANGNVIEPIPAFEQRWSELPPEWRVQCSLAVSRFC